MNVNNIVFDPYVGQNYSNNPIRLLVVGESHYGFEDNDPNASSITIESWRNGEKLRYFTILARIISGKLAKNLDRKNEFNQISFYNYVQAPMIDGIKTNFNENVDGSERAFREVLERLNPTHILATGMKNLWDILPNSDGISEDRFLADKSLPIRQYRTPDGFALATRIAHCSRASAPEWQGPVMAFLAGQVNKSD